MVYERTTRLRPHTQLLSTSITQMPVLQYFTTVTPIGPSRRYVRASTLRGGGGLHTANITWPGMHPSRYQADSRKYSLIHRARERTNWSAAALGISSPYRLYHAIVRLHITSTIAGRRFYFQLHSLPTNSYDLSYQLTTLSTSHNDQ